MSTRHLLLGLLARGPQHGYELKRAHDDALPSAKPLAFGQVYATIGRLERDGLIEPAGSDRVAGPERVSYQLTHSGRTTLAEWLDAVETPAPHLGGALLEKVVVALLAADRDTATRYLVQQRAAHMARMRELIQVRQTATSVSEAAAADYTITHLDADLRWMQQTAARVDALEKEIRP
ncbi:MAG: PadR family transcriptional regulator [Hamadaea sp.]|uniref:PadR family transcriptional regulator n=1 Tax=Hamadaea sp. TaxID=2024425 RepID=UPI0017955162|nr:PadR family transcriptional regulator [Hamadaea sp.]NUT21828.1 PadR family transcriptional regulator [Hamadaea sp.]